MMAEGRVAYIKKWGFSRFFYTYLMLLLNRYIGLRLSVIRAKKVANSSLKGFESDGLSFRSLTIEDFQNEKWNLELDINLDFVKKAFARGDQCVGALQGEKLVGYVWRTTQQVQVENSVYMSFGNQLYYRFKGFIHPDFRGKNIFNQIKHLAESESVGKQRLYSFGVIETHNYPSLIASKKSGDQTLGYSGYIQNRLFFLSWGSKGAHSKGIKVFRLIK
jgi:hypothetical protein